MRNLDVPGTVAANLWLFAFLGVCWLAAFLWSCWDCLARLSGIERLTWLVAILGIPGVGFVFYLMKGVDEGTKNGRRLKGFDDL